MDFLQLCIQNFLSPALLFFILGMAGGILKSDLDFPKSISNYFTMYLMMSIGFQGGVAIAATDNFTAEILYTSAAGVAVSFLFPFLGYFLLKLTTRLDKTNAAAVAAHYGSISLVTFATAASFLKIKGLTYDGYIVAVLALMEAPAILSGLYILNKVAPSRVVHTEKVTYRLSREIFTNGAILLLIGSFIIGWITGKKGLEKMDAFLVQPFQGILALFLLDMGLIVSRQLNHLKDFNFKLVIFGFYMPLLGALIGLIISKVIGLSVGTGMLFTVLCGSASYIAVPAAIRLAVPKAKATIYITMSLAVTFPFNIVVGIPIYYVLSQFFLN